MVTSCTGLVLNIEADPFLTEAKRGTGNSRDLKDHWYLVDGLDTGRVSC